MHKQTPTTATPAVMHSVKKKKTVQPLPDFDSFVCTLVIDVLSIIHIVFLLNIERKNKNVLGNTSIDIKNTI